MIQLEQLSKFYGSDHDAICALNNVDLTVPKGSITGVIGVSGAGKSTLIRCVNMLERPSSGRVLVDGQDLTQLDAPALRKARHDIGMIFQHFNLLDSRTVYQNIAFPLELMGFDKNAMKERITPLLELTGLSDKKDRYPSALSGGQKQRVAIARALASRPKVLLCDEATSALDPQTTASILELLREINQELGLTILLITHEMEVVKSICDSVALISGGELVETSKVGPFFTAPSTKLGREFLEEFLRIDPPKSLLDRLSSDGRDKPYPVIRIIFNDDNVASPLISQLARSFELDISILQAKIEDIQGYTLGLMIAEFRGDSAHVEKALAKLSDMQLSTEVLGYVD
ncbi:methionine ABC transporter ATP-binding protein [Larsenimonas salina]|uniref:methionine ABC transporter ATP-binding protein n=1 Tax=Larsenimonas salina TaxID=1295565 RepID=UPI002072BC42|nr:methionine ABC transporter ATP-binding protein [Larsenimonas salina]MCM5703682.1 methionine ABC transporter ATP-binding protein [Larsenimonas salina]